MYRPLPAPLQSGEYLQARVQMQGHSMLVSRFWNCSCRWRSLLRGRYAGVKLAEVRERLFSIRWWMRLLCQRVAQRANHEEEESGRFFQDRYRATRLVDEASLLACAAYVDLNPIRAAMCQTLESSVHTSVQRRIAAITNQEDSEPVAAAAEELQDSTKPALPMSAIPRQSDGDSFLAPLTIDERHDRIGPSLDQSIYSHRDLCTHFTVRTAVLKEIPSRSRRYNIPGNATLVITFVPFGQFLVNIRIV